MIDDDNDDDDDGLPFVAFGTLHCDLANIIIDHDHYDHDTNIVHYDLDGDDDDGDLEMSLISRGTLKS